ncbi:hypothetical protein [Methylobacterium sp.]|uniref:hypothetical protein n=1 Tax=Methylobacterium sp. TaxID=409 RepID=UPI0025E3B9FD|nr:hypothetical protein [Methylobacterium sp.]MBY0257530.1 hypothetical protein [Methylobacterium sp.]
MFSAPIPAETRAVVEAAMRGTRRSVRDIATETGVAEATIRTWNRRSGWRPVAVEGPRGLDPLRWTAARRAAVARLYRHPWIDIADLAHAMGLPGRRAEALFAACGLEGRRPGVVADATGPETDPGRLRAALRAHIARQILRFDAALNAESGDDQKNADPKRFDSARVLRDLGGLKRLLDETDRDAAPVGSAGIGPARTDSRKDARDGEGSGEDSGHASGDAGHDLPALRAEIARRAEALGGERADAGPAGEPAAAPDPGARG